MERQSVGRYTLGPLLATGGQGAVYLGYYVTPAGGPRVVAIKTLLDPTNDAFGVVDLLDEARMAMRVRHANVVPVLDVVVERESVFIVMEWVEGLALSKVLAAAQGKPPPLPIALAIAQDLLQGLGAAHEAKSEKGEPLSLIHRDICPHNLVVGSDGVTRLLDFGIARATNRLQSTQTPGFRGRLRYAPPEALEGFTYSVAGDIFSASVVLWELLTCRQRVGAKSESEVLYAVLALDPQPPSSVEPSVPADLDAVTLRGLARDPGARWPSAAALHDALGSAGRVASRRDVAAWMRSVAADELDHRIAMVRALEVASTKIEDTPPTRSSAGPPNDSRMPEDATAAPPTEAVAVPPRPRRGWRRAAVMGVLLLFVVVTAGVATLLRSTRSADAEAAIRTSPPPSAPSAVPEPSATEPMPVVSSAAVHASPPRRPLMHPRPKSAPTASCTPPYVIDDDGHRKYKPECFPERNPTP